MRLVSGIGLSVIAAAGCQGDLEPDAQYVVFVDVNLPVPSHVAAHPEWRAASVDTLRIEALDGETCGPQREIVAPDASDWPVSFGVVFEDATTPVSLRLRAFASASAVAETVCGTTLLRAPAASTVERVVTLSPPDGIEVVRVVLDGACRNRRPSFQDGAEVTCVSASALEASPEDGVESLVAPPSGSVAGTWAGAASRECRGQGPEGAVCVPGGFTQLGDVDLAGFGNAGTFVEPTPPRPVVLSPFWMDRHEVTVQQFEALENPPEATSFDPSNPNASFCNLGRGEGSMPMNCLSRKAARSVCAARGGTLPSEAQWEHAARGRGRGWRYPWGDTVADDCVASVDRPTLGTEPVASHPAGRCASNEHGDVSLDGVVDLAGSVAEHVRDDLLAYDQGCWSRPGVFVDPVCDADEPSVEGSRGGDWSSAASFAASPLRREAMVSNARLGFRCVYADES